jgi:hypothetical protein
MKVGRMVGDREPEEEPNTPPEGGKGDVDEGREGKEWRATRAVVAGSGERRVFYFLCHFFPFLSSVSSFVIF